MSALAQMPELIRQARERLHSASLAIEERRADDAKVDLRRLEEIARWAQLVLEAAR